MSHTPTAVEMAESAPNYVTAAMNACSKAGLSIEALESGVVVDLLEACEKVVEHIEWRNQITGGGSTWEYGIRAPLPTVRAAIAKARGQK